MVFGSSSAGQGLKLVKIEELREVIKYNLAVGK